MQRAESYISYLGIYQPAIFSCGSMLPLCKGHHEKASGVRACVYWYSSIPYPFSSPTHQHSAHHPSRHPTKGNYRAGTEKTQAGARWSQSSCRPSSISSIDSAALPLSIFLQNPNTNTRPVRCSCPRKLSEPDSRCWQPRLCCGKVQCREIRWMGFCYPSTQQGETKGRLGMTLSIV